MSSSSSQPMVQMRVDELAERLQIMVAPLQLIDVREPDEWAIAHLDHFLHCPLSQFEQWSGSLLDRLDPAIETVVMCHHGIRSAYMCQWLQDQGFTNVKNLVGGIDAYASAIDPTLRRY
ncbi:MAG: rhodanese-like domain-containing protein [Leptolyngbyaceae bacterium]|nr:rhodanese-like domain-containing protein [Leptolyngbyaceae bacterium]